MSYSTIKSLDKLIEERKTKEAQNREKSNL